MFVGQNSFNFDPTVETRPVIFDFGPGVAAGLVILTVAITCVAISGTDAQAEQRIVGGFNLVPSPETGALSCAVVQKIGTLLKGVTYQIQVVVTLDDGSTRSLRWNIGAASLPGA